MAAAEVQQAQQAPVTRYQGVDKRSSGYKLLAAMGWKEGEGLGAARQGIKEHIKVKKKFENWGVGAVEAAEKARDWTTGMLDFTRVLSTLSEVTSQHARGDSGYDSSSESEGQRSDASDGQVRRQRAAREAAAAAEGGEAGRKKAAAGAKAGRKGALKKGKGAAGEEGAAAAAEEKKAGKKKKKEKKSSKASEDAAQPSAKKRRKASTAAGPGSGGSSSSSDSESGSNDSGSDSGGEGAAGGATAAAPKRVKFATHVGRFKRREAAKMVKNYSSTDLAAILGGTSSGGAAAAAAVDPTMDMVFPSVEIRAQRPVSSSDNDDSSGSDGEGRSGGAAAAAAPSGGGATSSAMATSGRSGAGASSSGEPGDSALLEVVDAGEGTWWGGYFAKAAWRAGGRAGASGRPSITIHGFREEDQENLYNLAQDGRTQGRVGLGRSSMPKKVAGTRWAGKKTRLGSDSEDEVDEEQQQQQQLEQEQAQAGEGSDAPGEVHLGNGVVIVLPPSRRAELEPQLLLRQAAVAAEQQQGQQQGGQQAAAAGPAAGGKSSKRGKRSGSKGAAPAAEALANGGGSIGADLGSIKWRKLVLSQLKSSGKSKLSVSKLSKAISKQRGLGKAERARVEEMVAAAAGACSKLSLRDGVVRMTAAE